MTPLAKKVAELFGKPETESAADKPRLKIVTKTAEPARSGRRSFLPRPLGTEEDADVWDAHTPFMVWLLEYHADCYHLICDAEDTLNSLEKQGIGSGAVYQAACEALLQHVETGRALAFKERVKVWVQ